MKAKTTDEKEIKRFWAAWEAAYDEAVKNGANLEQLLNWSGMPISDRLGAGSLRLLDKGGRGYVTGSGKGEYRCHPYGDGLLFEGRRRSFADGAGDLGFKAGRLHLWEVTETSRPDLKAGECVDRTTETMARLHKVLLELVTLIDAGISTETLKKGAEKESPLKVARELLIEQYKMTTKH